MFIFAAVAADDAGGNDTRDVGNVLVGQTSRRFTSSQLVRDRAAADRASERYKTPWSWQA